jgi:endonuclease/exonuclease/phosphatase (EEP) superfamily protein YafD
VACVSGAAALAGLRWQATDTPVVIAAVGLTPLGVPAGVVAVLSSVVLVVLTRGRARALTTALLVVAVVLTVAHLWWQAPLVLGPAAPTRGPGLTVLLQNVEDADPSAFAARVTAADADVVVCVQPMGDFVEAALAAGLRASHPYAVGTGANGGAGPAGAVVISRLPLSGAEWIPNGGESRVVTVRAPDLGTAVDIFALHPRSPSHGRLWAADHRGIAGFLDDRYGDAPLPPALVAGDLNATLDHRPVRALEARGFSDAVDQTNGGLQPTWPAPGTRRQWGLAVPPFVQIDHVMVSPRLVVTRVERFATPGTDHLGLVAQVHAAVHAAVPAASGG